jgi:hypothetical protein
VTIIHKTFVEDHGVMLHAKYICSGHCKLGDFYEMFPKYINRSLPKLSDPDGGSHDLLDTACKRRLVDMHLSIQQWGKF